MYNKWKKFTGLGLMWFCVAGMAAAQTNVSFLITQANPARNPGGFANTPSLDFSSIPDFSNIVDLTVSLKTWTPDKRNADLSTILDAEADASLLSAGAGPNPTGWTLFLTDLDYGERDALTTKSLAVTAVPEPSSTGVALLGLGVCFGWWRLARRSSQGVRRFSKQILSGSRR